MEEKYRFIHAIKENDEKEFGIKVDMVIHEQCGTVLSTSCGIENGKAVFMAIIGTMK